jgi:hypothetical protein
MSAVTGKKIRMKRLQHHNPKASMSAVSSDFRDRWPAGLAREELNDAVNGRVKA